MGVRVSLALALSGLLCATPVMAQSPEDLADLTLEDLLASEVTSVAKRPQTVETSAAAVFVIGREDIRRSGARSIPEVLRMAPGLEVATTGSGGFAVSARGFNGRFGNKLLVLVDGRTVYLSTLSGVLWDQQLVPLDLIERIEVVRGPGGALWGANAVNSVINIITRHAVDSLGGRANVEVDDQGGHVVSVAQGWALSQGALRLYATDSHAEVDATASTGMQAGFRYDVDLDEDDALTFQGDVQQGDYVAVSGAAGTPMQVADRGDYDGVNLLARWARGVDRRTGFTVQAYWDHIERQTIEIDLVRDLVDLEASRYFGVGRRHDLLVGVNLRTSHDDVIGSEFVRFDPRRRTLTSYGAFVQDEIGVIPGRFTVTLGAKAEYDDQAGLEVQPSVRALLRTDHGTLWAAASRAVRTPSRFEADGMLTALGGSSQWMDSDLEVEQLLAIEIGWRATPRPWLSVDATAFRNKYTDLLGFVSTSADGLPPVGGPPPPVGEAPAPNPNADVRSDNVGDAVTHGAEVSIEARPTPRWTIKASASWFEAKETLPSGAFVQRINDLSSSPESQISLRSWFDVTDRLEADVWVRRVSAVNDGAIPAYTDLDVQLTWRVTDRLEARLIGDNLLEETRAEIGAILTPSIEIPRRVSAGLRVRY